MEEGYVLYMPKMFYLKKNQILKQCNKLNSSIINLDINNNNNYIHYNSNLVYNIKDLKNRAKKEIKMMDLFSI